MGRKLGTDNSCFVALIATESVSIAIPWPLLPLEVGVNRHGLFKIAIQGQSWSLCAHVGSTLPATLCESISLSCANPELATTRKCKILEARLSKQLLWLHMTRLLKLHAEVMFEYRLCTDLN